MKNPHLYGVILAGGSGTRFWPLSRERFPKQFLRIIGEETLIQQTLRRLLGAMPANRVFIVTNEQQADSIELQLIDWKDELDENLILEPEGRNTAPAIGIAAFHLIEKDPEAVMVVLPADQVIKPTIKFHQAVKVGARLATEGHLVTFGIPPTRPETGYGYIQPDRRNRLCSVGTLSGYRVNQFVEKPNLQKAKRYMRSGNFFWNSGEGLDRVGRTVQAQSRSFPITQTDSYLVAIWGFQGKGG